MKETGEYDRRALEFFKGFLHGTESEKENAPCKQTAAAI
jgi:hypothetical protein